MIRELVLQMKLGRVYREYLLDKFGIDVQQRFPAQLAWLRDHRFLVSDADGLRLSRDGLLQVDRLVQQFFLSEHRLAQPA